MPTPGGSSSGDSPKPTDPAPVSTSLLLEALSAQLAVVRALTDQTEILAASARQGGVSDQLRHEITKLGRRLLEVAAALAEPARHGDERD
jgi:hypothetical protein